MPRTEKGAGKAFAFLVAHKDYQGDDCLKWPFCTNPNGYGQMGHMGKRYYSHRLMCEIAHGAPPSPDHEAAHSCGNGKFGCVNQRHLSWKTKSGNRIDALRHGTGVRGAPNGSVGTLTMEQVAEIKSLKGTMRQIDIAERYGISPPRVRAIFTDRIYRSDKKIVPWTPEQDAKLRAAIDMGYPIKQISAEIGKTHDATVARMYRLRLHCRSGHHSCRLSP